MEDSMVFMQLIGQMLLFVTIFALGIYVYMALALMAIAKKTKTSDAWMAWVPILNIYLMLKIADRPGWWLLLLLIPLVNLIITIIVWMAIAEKVNKPNWMGVLIIVPVVNFFVPGILAWTDSSLAQPQQSPETVTSSEAMNENQDNNINQKM